MIFIHRYLRRELPEILSKKTGGVLLVPPSFPAECPYLAEKRRTGWEAEKFAFECLKAGLEELHKRHPHLVISLFHGMRYSWTEGNASAPACAKAKQAKAVKTFQSEIDMVLVVDDERTGMNS